MLIYSFTISACPVSQWQVPILLGSHCEHHLLYLKMALAVYFVVQCHMLLLLSKVFSLKPILRSRYSVTVQIFLSFFQELYYLPKMVMAYRRNITIYCGKTADLVYQNL